MELVIIKVKRWRDIPENYTGIVEYADGEKWWYLNGEFHRTDGPSIEYSDGIKCWHLKGKQYTKEEHFQYVAEHYPESIRKLIWNL